jgi:hypothetical protein
VACNSVSGQHASSGRSGPAYVDDAAQCSQSIRSVYSIASTTSVLHDGARNHDDILGGCGQLLNDEHDHLAETGIFVLEELGDSEEEGGGFVAGEGLSGVEKQGDLGKENAALARLDRRAIE